VPFIQPERKRAPGSAGAAAKMLILRTESDGRSPGSQTSISRSNYRRAHQHAAAPEKLPSPFGLAAALQALPSFNFRDSPGFPFVRGTGT